MENEIGCGVVVLAGIFVAFFVGMETHNWAAVLITLFSTVIGLALLIRTMDFLRDHLGN